MKTEMEAARDAAINAELEGYDPDDDSRGKARRAFERIWDAARGSQWVAVSDRQPDISGRYYVVMDDARDGERMYSVGIFRKGEKLAWSSEREYSHYMMVAWHPIPPYTADSGQEGE